MDVSCIISSGDLELYVLGMLSADEASKVEQLMLLFPEITEEVTAIEDALLFTAAAAAEAPSAAVKNSLFSKLSTMKADEDAQTYNTIANNTSDPQEEKDHITKVVPLQLKKRTNTWLAAASVIALIAAVAVVSYMLVTTNQSRTQMAALQLQRDSLRNSAAVQQQQLANVQTQVDSLQKNASVQKNRLNEYAQSVEIYQNKDYQKINLTNVPGKPDALVQILWNKKTQSVYAANVSLPKVPSGKQYQLWAIVKGKPVSAGLLDNSRQLIEHMRNFAQADAFAVTLENKGGSATPTLTQMYVMGKTS